MWRRARAAAGSGARRFQRFQRRDGRKGRGSLRGARARRAPGVRTRRERGDERERDRVAPELAPGAPGAAQRLPTLLADALSCSPPTDDAGFEPGTYSRRAASAHYRSWTANRRVGSGRDRAAAGVVPGGFGGRSAAPRRAADTSRLILGDSELGESVPGSSSVERPRMAALELLATLPPPPTPPLAAARECARACRITSDVAATQRELGVLELLSTEGRRTREGCWR